MNIISARPMPDPDRLKQEMPLSDEMIKQRDLIIHEIKNILSAKDKRLLVIIGPCSVDNREALMEYLDRLAPVRDLVANDLLIIPRVYTNKPRSSGMGYKGIADRPYPNKDSDLIEGVYTCRKIYMEALEKYRFLPSDELLYPDFFAYLDDLTGYLTVGARSVSNQFHRLFASACSIPVAMKNPPLPYFDPMINAINAARSPQIFEYRSFEYKSKGNPYAHALLRGFVDEKGKNIENYDPQSLNLLFIRFKDLNIAPSPFLIDCNHANSDKNYLKQVEIAKSLMAWLPSYPPFKDYFRGFMIESYLKEGRQEEGGSVYGQSITDPCLDFQRSKELLLDLAECSYKNRP